MKDCLPSTHRVSLEPIRDGPRSCMREEGQRLALARRGLSAGQRCLPWRLRPEEQPGRVGKGPREVRMADLGPRGALACASGCPGTRDQAAVRDDILPPGKATQSLDGIEHDQGQALPPRGWNAGGRRGGVVLLGRVHDRQRESGEESVVRGEQRKIDCDVLVPCGIVKAFCHPAPVGLVGHLLAHVGQVIRAGGLLDMRQKLCPCAPQGSAAPQEVTGGTPLSRLDVGLREQAAAQEGGNLWRLDLVICGLATVDGFHIQGVPEDEGNILWSAEVSEPIRR